MARFVDTVPTEDKKKILDLYYGKGDNRANAMDRWEISKAMGKKYTPAQIYSVILDDIDGEDNG